MNTFGRSSGGGRRSASREQVATPAVVTTVQSSRAALLADLSTTGARLSGINLPCQGQAVSLKVDCVRAFGLVVWSDDGECGIAFDGALPAFEVERLKREIQRSAGGRQSLEVKLAFDEWSSGFAR